MTDEKGTDGQSSTADKMSNLLSAIKPAAAQLPVLPGRKPEPAKAATPELEPVAKKELQKILTEGRKKNPVQNAVLQETELVRVAIYLTEKERKDFKFLCLMDDSNMSELLRSWVQQHIQQNKGKLPAR
jgi:hypothetical protein